MARSSLRDFAPPWRWGVFRWRPCTDLAFDAGHTDAESMRELYSVLKAIGFRETFWQIVYPGQVGGLIKNPGGHFLEFHVRFFEDSRIYAEIEIGRSVALHFLMHRFYANDYLENVLKRRVSRPGMILFTDGVTKYKATSDKQWSEWRPGVKFMAPRTKRWLNVIAAFSDWRVLACAMGLAILAANGMQYKLFAAVSLAMILIYFIAPRR